MHPSFVFSSIQTLANTLLGRLDQLGKLATHPDLLLGAVRSSAFRLVWWLLDKGAKIGPETNNDDRSKLLFEAIQRDDPDIVELLLKRGAYLKVYCGDTPLHVAAQLGSADVAKRLLDIGADPSAANPRGETPLLVAARYSSTNIVRCLLDRGIDISTKNSYGENSLHQAVMGRRSEIVSMLLGSGSDVYINSENCMHETSLHIAVGSEDIDTTVMLLEHGASLSAINWKGDTPVHLAVRYGTDIILDKFLNYVKQSCDLDIANQDGYTALHLAVESSSLTKVAALLRKQANLLVTNPFGRTPIHSAVKHSTPELLEMMLGYVKESSHLDLRDKDGDTPLHMAICENSLAKVAILLKKGADVLARSRYKERRPIHYAAKYNKFEILKLLLGHVKQLCNLDLCDGGGDTALHLAIRAGSAVMVENLLKKGANFTMLNSVGESALVMALSSNEEGIRELGRQYQDSLAMYSAIPYLGDDACNIESSISWSGSKWC